MKTKKLLVCIWVEIMKNCYAASKAIGSSVWMLAGILLVYHYTEARFSTFYWWAIFAMTAFGSYGFAKREWEAQHVKN